MFLTWWFWCLKGMQHTEMHCAESMEEMHYSCVSTCVNISILDRYGCFHHGGTPSYHHYHPFWWDFPLNYSIFGVPPWLWKPPYIEETQGTKSPNVKETPWIWNVWLKKNGIFLITCIFKKCPLKCSQEQPATTLDELPPPPQLMCMCTPNLKAPSSPLAINWSQRKSCLIL